MATTPSYQSQLKRLIREAGYSYQTVDRQRVEVLFGGPYRPWIILATLNAHWLSLCTYVCRAPETPGCKAELSDLLLRLNQENALTKYAYHDGDLFLELEYRAEHVDSAAMSGLLGLLCSCANDDYPRIARMVTGDETLNRLERQFKPQEQPQDADST